MTGKDFTDLLARFTKAVESADDDAFADLFCEDATYEDVFDGEFAGRDAIREMFIEHFHGLARDYRWEMHEPVFDGTVGYAHLTLSYTSMMKHSTGKRVVLTGACQFRLRDGKIATYREWALGLAGLSQLGTPDHLIARQADREAQRILRRTNAAAHGLKDAG